MLAESHDEEQIIARVAALESAKRVGVLCAGAGTGGRQMAIAGGTTHWTMTRSLTELANRLVELHVERVVMEATRSTGSRCSTCSKRRGWIRGWSTPAMSNICLVRPKTDVLDAVWLCNVAERQTLRPSFVSPWPIRRLRD